MYVIATPSTVKDEKKEKQNELLEYYSSFCVVCEW